MNKKSRILNFSETVWTLTSKISMTDHEQYINGIHQRTRPQAKQVLNIYIYTQ